MMRFSHTSFSRSIASTPNYINNSKLGLLFVSSLVVNKKFTISEWTSKYIFCPTEKRTQAFAIESCCANHQATNMQLVQLSYNNFLLILNSWSVTQLTFHFPEVINILFVSKFHTHYLEQDQFPKEFKPHSPHVNKTSK